MPTAKTEDLNPNSYVDALVSPPPPERSGLMELQPTPRSWIYIPNLNENPPRPSLGLAPNTQIQYEPMSRNFRSTEIIKA